MKRKVGLSLVLPVLGGLILVCVISFVGCGTPSPIVVTSPKIIATPEATTKQEVKITGTEAENLFTQIKNAIKQVTTCAYSSESILQLVSDNHNYNITDYEIQNVVIDLMNGNASNGAAASENGTMNGEKIDRPLTELEIGAYYYNGKCYIKNLDEYPGVWDEFTDHQEASQGFLVMYEPALQANILEKATVKSITLIDLNGPVYLVEIIPSVGTLSDYIGWKGYGHVSHEALAARADKFSIRYWFDKDDLSLRKLVMHIETGEDGSLSLFFLDLVFNFSMINEPVNIQFPAEITDKS
jgi:hypothetical protein